MISVAIASYDGAAYIGEQLASIAEQSLLPDELVVSDDGSRDGTPAIVEAFAATARFAVRLIRQPRQLGILENFYAAFAACAGDILVYCDQDDVWRPEKLARQAEAIARGAMLVAHPSRIVDASLHPLGRDEPVNPRYGSFAAPVDATALHAFGHQMMFRRAVLDLMVALRPAADRVSATRFQDNFDSYIPFCASLLGGIALLEEPFVLFRRHGGATSGAGYAADAAALPIAARAARKITHSLAEVRDAAAVAAAAIDREETGDCARRVLAGLRTRERGLAALAALSGTASRPRRLAALPGALRGVARPSGFSNDRRLHAAALALAAAMGSGG